MNSEQVKSAYARALGESIIVRRYTGSGSNRPRFDARARGQAARYRADELIGGITQGDQKVFILADDLISCGLPLPVTTNDKVVVHGRELAIISIIERKVDQPVIAYEIQARG